MNQMREALGEIHAMWKHFEAEWGSLRELWRDAVAERFEQGFIQPWRNEIPLWCRELGTLIEVMEQAERAIR